MFRIHRRDQDVCDNHNFHWKSYGFKDTPVGTHYSIDGSIIHAGAGADWGTVRIMLFWTWHKCGLEHYDNNQQTTKLTLMVDIGKELWPLLNKELRVEMLCLMYYCFYTSEDAYQVTCPYTFGCCKNVQNLLIEFAKVPKKTNKGKLYKVLNYFAIDEFFDE